MVNTVNCANETWHASFPVTRLHARTTWRFVCCWCWLTIQRPLLHITSNVSFGFIICSSNGMCAVCSKRITSVVHGNWTNLDTNTFGVIILCYEFASDKWWEMSKKILADGIAAHGWRLIDHHSESLWQGKNHHTKINWHFIAIIGICVMAACGMFSLDHRPYIVKFTTKPNVSLRLWAHSNAITWISIEWNLFSEPTLSAADNILVSSSTEMPHNRTATTTQPCFIQIFCVCALVVWIKS